jgi:3-mercaptopyruvate sulfurtransferase SseA
MRLFISMAAAVLLAVIVLTACNSNEQPRKLSQAQPPPHTPAQLPPPGDSARRITPAELKVEVASNHVLIIDVRGEAAYKQGHIKGAIQIPATEILTHIDRLPRDKMIATYCS